VLPHYLENGIQFGLLRPDLTPLPGFLAVSACANLIGDGEYLGELQDLPEGVQGRLFATARGNTVVLWATHATEVTLACPEGAAMAEYDVFGQERPLRAEGGRVSVVVWPEAVYVTGFGTARPGPVRGTVRPRGVLPRNVPSPVFVVGHTDLPQDKDHNTYLADAGKPISYDVDVYNLAGNGTHSGTLRLILPPGWSSTRETAEVTVGPMGRETARFSLVIREAGLGLQTVRVEADFPGLSVGAAVGDFILDPLTLKPTGERPLSLDAAAWKPSISNNGAAEQSQGAEGEYVLTARYDRPGDRWCYAAQGFEPPANFADYDAISFEVKTSTYDDGTRIRCIVGEPNGTRYYAASGVPARPDWQPVVLLFRDLQWGAFSQPDDNGRLDLERIVSLELGSNTTRDDITLQFRHLRLLKLH